MFILIQLPKKRSTYLNGLESLKHYLPFRLWIKKTTFLKNDIYYMCVSILPARMSMHSISDRCPRGHNPLELERQTVVSVCLCGWWESNLGSLKEQQVLLTARPYLWFHCLKCYEPQLTSHFISSFVGATTTMTLVRIKLYLILKDIDVWNWVICYRHF